MKAVERRSPSDVRRIRKKGRSEIWTSRKGRGGAEHSRAPRRGGDRDARAGRHGASDGGGDYHRPGQAHTAVSIGWQDHVEAASDEIERAISRVSEGRGVLLLTDMFGGTPTNIAAMF